MDFLMAGFPRQSGILLLHGAGVPFTIPVTSLFPMRYNTYVKYYACTEEIHMENDRNDSPRPIHIVQRLDVVETPYWSTISDLERALTGKTVSQGGVLPEDNIRVYVPVDLSEDAILYRLKEVYQVLGSPTWENESSFSAEFSQILMQLELYDQAWLQKEKAGHSPHSAHGLALAQKIKEMLEADEGNGECFPYEELEELERTYFS